MKKTLFMGLAMLLASVAATANVAPIHRSVTAKHAFMRANPCPSSRPHSRYSCPGFIVDHRIALDCGGLDAPSNMQWQTVAASKAKDKVERVGCVRVR